jgi:hypothetical protein
MEKLDGVVTTKVLISLLIDWFTNWLVY